MRLELDELREDAPNLTPLIDVVFLLLVFFLVATTFADQEVEMDLELPKASEGESQGDDHLLVIDVAADGRTFVEGREVGTEALRQKLSAAAERDPEREVLIRGDGRVDLERIVAALDACRMASLRRVSIAAAPTDGGR